MRGEKKLKKTRLLLFLLLVAFSLTSMAYADTYKAGSSGKAIEEIQQQLKSLGFFSGKIDGDFGPQTVTAVKKFQAKHGLSQDGVIGSGTYKYLFQKTSKASSESTTSNSDIKQSMSIKDIQAALKDLGYYTGTVDGVSGSNTENAIKKFQRSKKLTADGVVGPVTAKLLSGSTSSTSQTAKADGSKTSIASTKDVQAALRKLGYYTGTVDGVSGSKTTSAIKKFQKAYNLTADGVAGPSTRSRLQAAVSGSGTTTAKATTSVASASTSKSKHGVELLDWWSSASKIFKIGTIATVIDVRSGRTFKIMRTYGTNHADSEALTAKDSATIKSIWGGWSWARRPVVVEVGDIKIAASMAAMPHAGLDDAPANTYVSSRSGGYGRGENLDRIKDNGMNGHFDVHFLNSRTHGTNRVDAQHQAAVREAANSNY
jgi:peptidoglycan hydrolase-like protein with peptidoglycan-binding domain